MNAPVYRPQPIPYQGSKRLLANRILSVVRGLHFRRLYEPFAGSAAITIAAAATHVADTYLLSDTLDPLVVIWQRILECPESLADAYFYLWSGQADDPEGHYDRIRSEFNADGDPAKLLYLLARCVKNAPRFNREGGFNQSADRRRRGMHPVKMRRELMSAASYLHGRSRACCLDFEEAIADATPQDLVYMAPPYEGTTTGPHKRYHQGLDRDRLESAVRSQ